MKSKLGIDDRRPPPNEGHGPVRNRSTSGPTRNRLSYSRASRVAGQFVTGLPRNCADRSIIVDSRVAGQSVTGLPRSPSATVNTRVAGQFVTGLPRDHFSVNRRHHEGRGPVRNRSTSQEWATNTDYPKMLAYARLMSFLYRRSRIERRGPERTPGVNSHKLCFLSKLKMSLLSHF